MYYIFKRQGIGQILEIKVVKLLFSFFQNWISWHENYDDLTSTKSNSDGD